MASPSRPTRSRDVRPDDAAGPRGPSASRGRQSRIESDAEQPDQSVSRNELDATLKRAGEGDEHAWRVLVETYSARVFGLIRAQCGSPDLAEEITQSAFCTVVAKIGSYTELGKFEQWLFRIAMNRLRDEMRRRKRQARPMEDQALHAMADSGGAAGPGMAIAGGGRGESLDNGLAGADPEQLAALRAALADLPDADQQIIHLRHSAGLSFKEIADVLEQPLGTVLARQHRALKKLAEVLQPVVDQDSTIGRVRRRPEADAPPQAGSNPRPNLRDSREKGAGAQPAGP